MGYDKNKRPAAVPSVREYEGETLTSTQSGSVLRAHGPSFINSASTAGDNAWLLPDPVPGLRKAVVVNVGTTDAVLVVHESTASVFFGTTANALSFSTGSAFAAVELIGRTSTQWAVLAKTTGVTLAGSTVSTG